jgi:hypothetical protein
VPFRAALYSLGTETEYFSSVKYPSAPAPKISSSLPIRTCINVIVQFFLLSAPIHQQSHRLLSLSSISIDNRYRRASFVSLFFLSFVSAVDLLAMAKTSPKTSKGASKSPQQSNASGMSCPLRAPRSFAFVLCFFFTSVDYPLFDDFDDS